MRYLYEGVKELDSALAKLKSARMLLDKINKGRTEANKKNFGKIDMLVKEAMRLTDKHNKEMGKKK